MTSIFQRSREALNEIITVLNQLPGNEAYAASCSALSDATIGQHTRHIIELYQCLLEGYDKALVNYDARKREKLYEQDKDAAIAVMKMIQYELERENKDLNIMAETVGERMLIRSNYYREVLYNLEHCIHHQALIRVALVSAEGIMVHEEFGVAPSTIQYRRQCAQ